MRHKTLATLTGSAAAAVLVAGLVTGCALLERDAADSEAATAGTTLSSAAAEAHPSFLHGRITTVDGERYEGRLRFGGNEEATWGDYFNGFKDGNPWAEYAPDRLEGRRTFSFLGFQVRNPWAPSELRRQLMVRFGDVARIEARGRDLRVTLKSGAEFHLDRYAADDFADGVRVWDGTHGTVDLDEDRIRTIEFLAPPRPSAAPSYRLHGTVRTRQGDFTGALQWGREGSVGLDELTGRAADGELLRLPFITLRSIARRSGESAQVTLLDGRQAVLTGTRDVGKDHRGIYVDDPRYGRVLIPWNAFDRVDFTPAGAASADGDPAYGDFPAGSPLTGSVTTRAGRRLAGRLVFDLDESESTQTLDAPAEGVHYTIPFGLVGSIDRSGNAAGRVGLTLRSGEELQLESTDDLGDGNAGMLIFADGRARPEYVGWADVARIDFGHAAAVRRR